MADRALSPETKLLLTAQQSLLNRSDAQLAALRRAVAEPLSSMAGPSWYLLKGAAESYARVGDRHPLRAEISRLFAAAIELAAREGAPTAPPAYTGGALRHFERPDT